MIKNDFAKNTLYSLGGFSILVLSNFIYNAVAGRLLGADDYGVFTSFFYLLLAFSQPNNSIQLAVAKYSACESVSIKTALRDITPTLLLTASLLFVLLAIASPVLKSVYHLQSIFSVLIGAGVVVIWLLRAGYLGVYQGKMNFFSYGLNIGSEGLARMAAGLVFIILGYRIQGAIGASIVSGLFAIFLLIEGKFGFLVHHIHLKNWVVDNKIARDFLKACLVLLPFGLITSLDLGMVQWLVGGKESGYISGCGLFGKNLITLSLVFANVVYSYTIKDKQDTLWVGIILSVAMFVIAGIITTFFGHWIVLFVLGNEYLPMQNYLTLYIAASLPLGIMQNLVNFSIAKDIRAVRYLMWIFLILLFGLYYLVLTKASIPVLLYSMLAGGLALNGILALVIFDRLKKKKITLDTIYK